MKVLSIVGARPQFIKAAVVSRAFSEFPAEITEVLVHTGQHYDANMSEIFFEELNIPRPDYNLGVGGGSHGENTGRMLEKLEGLMLKIRPDWVLVYGDTDSTLAGALAAAKLHIPVAHVEAGLRSFNRRMPEEINRVLTDHVSSILFVPTATALKNLQEEGISLSKIHVVGDVMCDATHYYNGFSRKPDWFDELSLAESFVLCTVHRAENTDSVERMQGIIDGLERSGSPIILPLHPRTRNKLERLNIKLPENIHVVEPVGYLEMNWLEANCRLIATDSGGVQKEAYFHGKPCVTLRDETEWVELVEGGFNTLTGANPDLIDKAIRASNGSEFNIAIYGDGHSALKIVQGLLENTVVK
ncbi:non-hydrolyzing UDP-N-acetylglucosamine 2-epimerase [Pseudomonas sp. Mn2068]|uniref:non-hydrolyzing UDP-N-acetylglucosamine 2-epimerase n=1 Tax=Pseudomonas sp. Mn2068 TaxID=3395265 RepID=UPI003BD5B774